MSSRNVVARFVFVALVVLGCRFSLAIPDGVATTNPPLSHSPSVSPSPHPSPPNIPRQLPRWSLVVTAVGGVAVAIGCVIYCRRLKFCKSTKSRTYAPVAPQAGPASTYEPPDARPINASTCNHAIEPVGDVWYAAQCGDTQWLSSALRRGGSTEQTDSVNRSTPIITATHWGRLEAVRLLIAAGANVNARTPEGRTAVIDAVNNSHVAILRELLRAGADTKCDLALVGTPLTIAAARMDCDVMRVLIAHPRIGNLNAQDSVCVDLSATKGGHTFSNADGLQTGETALGVAVRFVSQNGGIPMMRLLLSDTRVDPNAPFYMGGRERDLQMRPLLYAAMVVNSVTAVRVLLGHPRIDVNALSSEMTALHGAVDTIDDASDYAVLKELLGHRGIDVNARVYTNSHGMTPLHSAAIRGRANAVRLLLAHPQVDPNAVNLRGFTPLELALEAGHADAVAVLRADPRVQQHRDADRPAAGDDDDDDDDGRNDGSNTHDDPRGPIN